jgi:hypothetical protein
MKFALFTIILVGGFSLLFSLLTSSIGFFLGFISFIAIAVIIFWIKNRQYPFKKKTQSTMLFVLTVIIFSYGCTIKVPMTPDCRNIRYKEKVPIEAGLLITEETQQYVFRGNPESFTAGGRPHEFPLGETLELASKLIFSKLFEDVSLIRRIDEGRSLKLTIKPEIDDFHFRYDQLSYAGFAVSCLSRIKVTVILFSGDVKLWEKTIESPDIRKGPWVVDFDYEKKLGESASEALVYSLNKIASKIAEDESLRTYILQQRPQLADQPQEKKKLTSIPKTAPAIKVTDQPTESPKVAAIPKEVSIVRVSLRKEPKGIINEAEIKNMLVEYGFFDVSRYVLGSFENHFVDNKDGTITDKATGLVWQKRGSTNSLDNRGAKEYVKDLNRRRFAGHSDWRMPTVEELASLIKKAKTKGVHLDPVFDNKQIRCWTADPSDPKSWSWMLGIWIIDFKNGTIITAEFKKPGSAVYTYTERNGINYVKAVRSVK